MLFSVWSHMPTQTVWIHNSIMNMMNGCSRKSYEWIWHRNLNMGHRIMIAIVMCWTIIYKQLFEHTLGPLHVTHLTIYLVDLWCTLRTNKSYKHHEYYICHFCISVQRSWNVLWNKTNHSKCIQFYNACLNVYCMAFVSNSTLYCRQNRIPACTNSTLYE